ncbi:MAG: hypothetical protein GXP33_10215 [Spirochaetes bacterium]|nr:hypothetical protein [Spirochaetota bacterium]
MRPFLLYRLAAVVSGAAAIGFKIDSLSVERARQLLRLFLFQLAFLFTIVSITLTELNQGRAQIYGSLTRVGGLMGVCYFYSPLPWLIYIRRSPF